MKVAIVADCLIKYGGAERVVDNLLKIYPNSDLYTLFITPEARLRIKKIFPKVNIYTSWNQIFVRRENISRYISIIKLWSNCYWRSLNLNKYNLILSSSHSFGSKNIVNYDGLHISYVHTPPRFLYDEFSEIGWVKKWPMKMILSPAWNYLRRLDIEGSKKPLMVANSKNVAKRIEKYYGKKSLVIYPPVKIDNLVKDNVKKDYYVCLSRLVKQKGINLAVKVCTKNNWPLIVIGNGPEIKQLKKNAGKNISFIENCSDKQKKIILRKAKALIYLSIEEDFGIVPIESMSEGTPVIGFASGGVKETVINKKTGILFYERTEFALEKAIREFNQKKWSGEKCRNQAEKFSERIFAIKFNGLIEKENKNFLKEVTKCDCWGLLVSCLGLNKTAERIIGWAENRDRKNVFCCGLNDVVLSKEKSKIKKILEKADLITPDGMPLVWRIRKYTKNHFAGRVYGPDLMRLILSKSSNNFKIKHFLLGGTNEENLQLLKRQIELDYPNINIMGQYSPPFCPEFSKTEINKMVTLIKSSGANVVWLGIGAEKQILLADKLKKRLDSGVILTVGAAFDFLAGIKTQCPKFIQNIGGEWLFRWLSEPTRLSKRYLKILKFYLDQSLKIK